MMSGSIVVEAALGVDACGDALTDEDVDLDGRDPFEDRAAMHRRLSRVALSVRAAARAGLAWAVRYMATRGEPMHAADELGPADRDFLRWLAGAALRLYLSESGEDVG